MGAGALALAAACTLAKGRWFRPLSRLAEAQAAFLPVALLLVLALPFGHARLFSELPPPHLALWLNPWFLFVREALAFAALSLAAWRFAAAARNGGNAPRQAALSCVVYAVAMTLIASDLVMALAPHFRSALFGAAYFLSALYGGCAGTVILAALRGSGAAGGEAGGLWYDLGRLLLALALLAFYCAFVQVLVIWYSNLPEEARFLVLRHFTETFGPVAWAAGGLAAAIPVAALLFRGVKTRGWALALVSGVALLGLWFERYLLVAPSILRGEGVPLGVFEVLVSAGFLGLMGLSVSFALRRTGRGAAS